MIEPARSGLPTDSRHLRNGSAPEPADVDAAVAPIADAIAALPRPALSPAFRARLHGELVRLDAQLAAAPARPARRWASIPWPRRHVAADAPPEQGPPGQHADPRRPHRSIVGLPTAATVLLVVALAAAAGLAYAAERSRPGDPLWPIRSAFVRWHAARPSAAPDAPGRGLAPTDRTSTPRPFRSIAVATIVRRTGQRPNATSGPVLPGVPIAEPAPATRMPVIRRPRPVPTAPATPFGNGVAAAARDVERPARPPVPARPTRPRATDDPGAMAPTTATPTGTPAVAPAAGTQTPGTAATSAPPSATATSTARPDSATIAGTVLLRNGGSVGPLAGMTVALSPVADDFPAGCDPSSPPAAVRSAVTNADGDWSVSLPSGRWIVAISGRCLGAQPLYVADFNGATARDACAALALPVADGSAPTQPIVVDVATAPGCGPVPTSTP